MLFNSINFIIFFPVVLIVYFVIPKKIKNFWLLLASYYYYMCWNAKYAILILISTVITYASGLLIDRVNKTDLDDAVKKRRKNLIVAASFVSNVEVFINKQYPDV